MRRSKKITAFVLLLIHGASVFSPGVSYALTNGPTAPESSQFQPASITNLVDPFTGDFSYNIPLLDVDGYPVNLAYSSGGGMDDEASWVGFGWNINPGSINRTMKGIPDDFNGTDKIKKEYNIRKDITGGITFNVSGEIFGLDYIGASAGGSCDIFYNNKRGLGVEIGANISATLNTAKHGAGEFTTGLAAGAQLGITSNSQTGADFNFGANMGISIKDKEGHCGALGLRFGGGLNSRAGLKSTTLGPSFNTSKAESRFEEDVRKIANIVLDANFKAPSEKSISSYPLGSSTTNYGMAFTPTITMPMVNESYSLSPQLGTEFWGFEAPNVQVTGHYTKQSLASPVQTFPAYGFLHSAKGRKDRYALLDFNREKEAPYQENSPTLSVPYITQDVFTATSHLGSSQFKAVTNSTGVFFDSYNTNSSSAFSLGVEFGGGAGVKGGGDFSGSGSSTVTQKWETNNDFLAHGDFKEAGSIDGEDAYFKLVGEKSSINKQYLNKIADRTPVKVQTANVDDQARAFSNLRSNSNIYPVSSAIARDKREARGELFTPLTAGDAQKYALDRFIRDYNPFEYGSGFACNNGEFSTYKTISRVSDTRKAHHLSEIKVTKNDGMRLVYGTPVYNNEQVDITMSVKGETPNALTNQVGYSLEDASTGNNKGTDHYFSKETIPPYATSYLLTGICSPDYTDVTGNGITDDDLGSAVKFNYSLINANYKWRTPNGEVPSGKDGYANFSDGYLSNPDDDKASFSYGRKELWYTHSIESKNMIAVFSLENRDDGYGFKPNGELDPGSQQKRLKRIDLYTKSELLTNPDNPTPIKSVHFEYDYQLFAGVPNNINGGGKLTLRSVYFTYGHSNSGDENRYYFAYNNEGEPFEYQQYDRWGNYKNKGWNAPYAGVNLNNNDFPYSIQNKEMADQGAGKWLLNEIELPSGGKIKVQYESDDYAFVQNKRAMQMAQIVGYGGHNNYINFQTADKIYVQLPEPTTPEKIKEDYFEGIDQLYFKSMMKLANQNIPKYGSTRPVNELVSGFAKVTEVELLSGHNDVAVVTLEKRGDYHPITAAAWQFLRLNLSEIAYPYDVREELGPLAFVQALITAIGNVAELVTPFESRAMRKGYASQAIPDKGFVRICSKFNKLGGGVRVKKVLMNDIWSEMVGTDNGRTTETGMQFDYTREHVFADGTKGTISSGVASYEPMAGSEENPYKLPINYQQKAHLTSNIFTVEEPLGESYFPAPSVGYSQVTIRNLDATGELVSNGYSVKKFYTAKDFPTVVKRTGLSKNKYNQSSIFGLFNVDQGNSVVLSQGFYVETNDMHGKPLSDETFDGSNKLLSGSYYHYKSSGTEEMSLDNNVMTLQPDGTVKSEIVGQEFEMYSDMREQITDNIGVTMNLNLDILFFAIVVVPIPTFIPIVQSNHCGYEAASTIKVVNKYAITDRVVTIENGSTMTSENILWDALTGQVLLTKTQNGFDDPLYNLSLPAYMVNEYERGMGAAYKNTGIIFKEVQVLNGKCISIDSYLVPGDELGVITDDNTSGVVWATNVSTDQDRSKPPVIRLINKDGSIVASGTYTFILLRSGRRNMMGASAFTVVSLQNPIKNGTISTDAKTEILNAGANTFSDEWTADVKNTNCLYSPEGNTQFRNSLPVSNSKKPVPVDELIRQQNTRRATKTGSLKPLTAGGITKSQTTGVASKPAAEGCDPCERSSFEEINSDNCKTIRWNCEQNYPQDQRSVFVVKSNCPGGGVEQRTVIIDREHLTATACFSQGCEDLDIEELKCEELKDECNVCTNEEAYTYEYYENKGISCVSVRLDCQGKTIPLDKRIVFNFSFTCKNMPPFTKRIILDRSHTSGEICFDRGIQACDGIEIIRDSWYCETIPPPGCSPCDPASYIITTTEPTKEGECGIKVRANYACHLPFPPNKTADLSFSLVCNGIACETKIITISSDKLSDEVCFNINTTSSACNACTHYTVNNIQFNGISGNACNIEPRCCPPPIKQRINPYYTGLKGNWRAKQNYVYITKREPQVDVEHNNTQQPTNLRKGGIFKDFVPFYTTKTITGIRQFASLIKNDNPVGNDDEQLYTLDDEDPSTQIEHNWIAPATIKKVNSKGMEVENKDALNKYSSAQFGFNDLLATAVAGNARNNEIGYDGFEDYSYTNSCGANANANLCNEDGHFNFKKALKDHSESVQLKTEYTENEIIKNAAHTGNYSIWVKGGAGNIANTERPIKNKLTTTYHKDGTEKYEIIDDQTILKEGGLLPTFSPWETKKYIISGWIKGDVALSTREEEDFSKAMIILEEWNKDDNATHPYYKTVAVKAGPKVEGWTRVMATFELPERANVKDYIKIILWPGDNDAYFDDIRIHPYDGNMKTFAYDYKTNRLMAELDENNYATFYEYNDEGQLLRNKKETEKGIATLKETRDRIRRNKR